jgi:disease resistance protein RPM1
MAALFPYAYRYLIVIDDIWDTKPWGILQCSLHDNGLKSIIITTTRILDVAEQIGGCYKQKPLTHESSKKLFYGRIFGSEGTCPGQYFEVSEKILKKCGGVPLAIITTSSLLANKSGNIKEWNDVCGSIGSGLARNPSMDGMRKILLLSYYDLPAHLKACLLYLSTFPEDYEIYKVRLIWKWIAEDFVHCEEESQSLFELGESYFNELLNRSLIQVADKNSDDTISSCRVHDMVLELICSLSREESFVTTVLGDSRQSMPSSGSNVRRLSLQSTTWPKMEMSKLRSVTIFRPAIINTMPSLSCCHLLRVLDLEGCNLKEHSSSLRFIGNLFHLRYLSLAGTGYAGELPVEIGKLQFLQTLRLYSTQIEELPSSIVGLTQLMFLWVDGRTSLPNGLLRHLPSLEMLWVLRVDSACIAEELGLLTQLRVLAVDLASDKEGIWDENMCTALVGSLGKLHKIQHLRVNSGDMAANLEGSVESLGNLSDLSIGTATSLPTWIRPALLLSSLEITVVQGRREDIQVLGRLQALRYLDLTVSGDIIQVLERFMVSPDSFPCATTCRFRRFSMVPSTFPPGAMPRLENFRFGIPLEDFSRGEFTTDDLALGHLPSLQVVQVDLYGAEKVSKEVVTEVKDKLRREADVHPNHCTPHTWLHDN